MFQSAMSSLWSPTFFIFLGGALSLFGTIWAARHQTLSERGAKERAEHTLAYLNGSASFELVHEIRQVEKQIVLSVLARNSGQYPAYDLTTRILDIDANGSDEIRGTSDFLKNPKIIWEKTPPSISPGGVMNLGNIPLSPNRVKVNLRIWIVSRKGTTNAFFRLEKDGNGVWNVLRS